MDIRKVETSSEPWYIGRTRDLTFFGRSRMAVFQRAMTHLSRPVGYVDETPLYKRPDTESGISVDPIDFSSLYYSE